MFTIFTNYRVMYKYSLDNSSKKFICPQCNKKTLVRYKDNELGQYLEPNAGRCDRESKCQYHLKPNGNKAIVDISKIVKPEPTCISFQAVLETLRGFKHNHFIQYLLLYFSWDQVKEAIVKYNICTHNHWPGATIFWHMDYECNVYSGKVMLYDPVTGKRVKKPYPHISWIHKIYNLKGFVLEQQLFGIHNLCDYEKGATVCIVESEKTAIIMSILLPDYLWLATGSKVNFKEALLKPLKNYNVVVYPDCSEYTDWYTKCELLKTKGYTIICSKLIEDYTDKEGSDLVDLIIN